MVLFSDIGGQAAVCLRSGCCFAFGYLSFSFFFGVGRGLGHMAFFGLYSHFATTISIGVWTGDGMAWVLDRFDWFLPVY